MPKIKTREKVQGIKTLDKAAVAGERMKEVYIRSKEQFTNLTDDRSENPNAYAGDKAVSYTHLDVYKRPAVERRREENGCVCGNSG